MAFEKLNVHHLISFCRVAQTKSLSVAAQDLGLSQPAVSRQLAQLQASLGQRLYQRRRHGIELSPEGEQLQPYACALAEQFAETQAFLRRQSITELRIGLSHHLTTRYTGALLREINSYQREFASLQVHFLEGYSSQLLAQVQDHSLDASIIVATELAQNEELEASLIGKDDICLLCLPDDPIASEQSLSFERVKDETLLLSSMDSQLNKTVLQIFNKRQIQPDRLIEVSGPAAVRTAVMAGQGIGIMLQSFVQPEVEAGWLTCIALEEGASVDLVFVLPRSSSLSISKRSLLHSLRDQM